MKVLIFILLTFLEFGENKKILDKIYIYENSPKVYGNVIIGFVAIDTLYRVTKTTYKITFKKGNITKIKRSTHYYYGKIKQLKNDNIMLEDENLICYSSQNFSNNKKYSEDIYKMIDKSFLLMENWDRIKILENLILALESP